MVVYKHSVTGLSMPPFPRQRQGHFTVAAGLREQCLNYVRVARSESVDRGKKVQLPRAIPPLPDERDGLEPVCFEPVEPVPKGEDVVRAMRATN